MIFSIAMRADYSFYVKTIETHARAFFKVIIFSISSVLWKTVMLHGKKLQNATQHPVHTTYRKKNNLEKCAGMGLNGFHTKLLIGTHCN